LNRDLSARDTLYEFTPLDLQQNGTGCLILVDQEKMAIIGTSKRRRMEEDNLCKENFNGNISCTVKTTRINTGLRRKNYRGKNLK
jgi:hypothetical protein